MAGPVPPELPPRRGRRDNGLPASAYVPLADVDPRVGEHLLDLLKLAGVPAYLEPSADVEPYTRALALPSPPTDRLWVDREQRAAAREIVQAEADSSGASRAPAPAFGPEERPSAGLSDVDEERAWEEIVATWDDDPAETVPRWPVVEDASLDADPDGDSDLDTHLDSDVDGDAADAGPSGRTRSGHLGPTPDSEAATVETPRPDEDEEHYVPPPPPPVPRLSGPALLGLALIAFGALLLITPTWVGLNEQAGFTFGVLSVLSGAGVLVLRLRDSRSDDGPDNGAVI
jgi:hypothetical protein